MKNEAANSWAKKEITALIDRNIVRGSDEGLKLLDNISRAEFLALILRTVGIDPVQYKGGMGDVFSGDWYADIIQAGIDNNIVSGDGINYRPGDDISREEAAKIMITALGMGAESFEDIEDGSFADADSISEWAVPFINLAQKLGLINGFEDGTFGPLLNLTREQAMAMCYRIMTEG